MYRFFVDLAQLQMDDQRRVQTVTIDGAEAAHAARVLRLGPGTQVVVCDGTGMEYLAVFESVSPNACQARVTAQRLCPAEPELSICLFQGLAKGEKMDWVVQKCTELGITAILPVQTEHSVVRLDAAKGKARAERWQKVAQEAAKQCGRAVPPRIYPPMSLPEAVAQVHVDYMIIPWEQASIPLHEALQQARHKGLGAENNQQLAGAPEDDFKGATYNIGIIIGPEGGLSTAEVEPLLAQGAVPVTLGPRILRTETAAIATLTAVLYEFAQFGGNRTMEEWR